jgi:hypothetical protein
MAKNYWEEHTVSGTELMAMRMMRKKSHHDMVRLSRSKKYRSKLVMIIPSVKEFDWYEKNCGECPQDLVEFYMVSLGIIGSHMAQFKKILKGQLKTFEEGRTISTAVKRQVKAKYNHKCAHCGSKEKLHLHHKEHFSKGGQNTVENLILLCVNCHAEEHKEESYYNFIKSQA